MIDYSPDDWIITWPDIDGPIPVECLSCKKVCDESDMRRPLSSAERQLGRSGWVSTLVCKTCRAEKERALAPSALRRKLIQQGSLPAVAIDMRVAQAKEKSRKKSSKAQRARRVTQYEEVTRAVLKEIDREKAQFRARSHYVRNCGDPARTGAAPALAAYADMLAYVMTCVRMRAKDGRSPTTPWQENLYITPMCSQLLAEVVPQMDAAGESCPKAFTAGYPAWWSDRDRLLAAKAPPKEEKDDSTVDPTDFDAIAAKARAQWDKRNMGTKLPRKPRTNPYIKPLSIPGVDPVFTADDPPRKRKPREKTMSAAERLALMNEDLRPGYVPLTPRRAPPPPPDLRPYINRLGLRVNPAGPHQTYVPPAPVAPRTPEEMAAEEDRIRAENEALFRTFNLPHAKEDTD